MMNDRWKICKEECYIWMELAPSLEYKWKRKSEWMDKWNWKAMDT